MALTVIKNWDKKTWLSSKDYIKSFNNFLTKKIKLNSQSKVLDIGCGRGKILGNLSAKLRFKNKPTGIDITNHKDKDKRIKFKKINALTFFLNNKHKFDLILIKQTLHLLNLKEIVKLLDLSINNLSNKGKILILSLDTSQNELPTFKLMKKKLLVSLKRDKRILKLITKLYPHKKSKFTFKVNITKKKYSQMILNRFMSTLLPLTKKQLSSGVMEIDFNYPDKIKFKDKLICIIL